MRGGVAASIGAYSIDAAAFEEGLRFFRADRFAEARRAFARADRGAARSRGRSTTSPTPSCAKAGAASTPTMRSTGRREVALQRALAAAGGGVVRVDDDPDLTLKTSDEMAEALARGLRRDASDLNPLSMLEKRP